MTANELITFSQVRERIFDTLKVTYPDKELVSYINDAIAFIWPTLMVGQYYEIIGDAVYTSNTSRIPNDFLKFVAKYPVVVNNLGDIIIYAGSIPLEVRYIKKPFTINDINDNMPFASIPLNNIIAKAVIMLALLKNEYDISAEKALLDEVKVAIS